jgi:hypothetical protein
LPGEPDSDAARPVEEWLLERRRTERLAGGSLACPACDLPIALGAPVAVSAGLDCPYCRRMAPAREYLRLGTAVPAGSRVAIVASF